MKFLRKEMHQEHQTRDVKNLQSEGKAKQGNAETKNIKARKI